MKPIFVCLPTVVEYINEKAIVEAELMGIEPPLAELKIEDVFININHIIAIASEGFGDNETAVWVVDTPLWRVKLSMSDVVEKIDKALDAREYPYGI